MSWVSTNQAKQLLEHHDYRALRTPPKRKSCGVRGQKVAATESSHNIVPNTTDMSLEQWVALEEKRSNKANPREAVRRIKKAQQGSTMLNLDCLNLHTLPPLIGCQHITAYTLTGNYLCQVPENIGDLPNLKLLEINTNGLTSIPEFKRYKRLEILGIKDNPVRHIPISLVERGVHITAFNTFCNRRGRSHYRTHMRRQKAREFILRLWPKAPECFLPWVDERVFWLSSKYASKISKTAS